MTTMMMREAICAALAEEMERDERVFLIGEDIGIGGVFNVTPGLLERFGPDRVVDTPISELAITSGAFGAALRGLRPVVEIMFGDFLALALDSLVNQSAKLPFTSNNQFTVPMVVRTCVGAGVGLGPIHSETPTNWIIAQSGLNLVAPSNAVDAKGLLKAAIRLDEPVIFFEHKLLYAAKREVPDDLEPIEIGKAAIVREGGDITIVAALAMVGTALGAAEDLAERGIEAEVVDLRSLRPLDREAILESVRKTRRLVVVEEGAPAGGYAAEVIAVVAESEPGIPVRRVTMPDIPVAVSPPLEKATLPTAERVVRAVDAVLSQPRPEIVGVR